MEAVDQVRGAPRVGRKAGCALWGGRGADPPLFLSRSLCPQLASAGTFRVVKEPLAFLRVLEWVSAGLSGVRARRNRWELGRAQGQGHGARGRGLASFRAEGWVCGCAPAPSLCWLYTNLKKKKKTNIVENKILVMHLANLSLGRAGKEGDNWCAEQCHCVLL